MANKMSLNSYLDHHLCLIFQIWLHNNASWQKGHLIVHLAVICGFDSLRGLGIDIIDRVHFDNRDRFAIWMGIIGKGAEPCQQTSGCSDF